MLQLDRDAVLPSCESTQPLCVALADAGAPEGTVVWTWEQTRGRGRGEHSWASPSDSGLWLSFVLRPTLPTEEWPALTALVACAAAEAIEGFGRPGAVPSLVQIKWPNDLFGRCGKLGGVLAQSVSDGLVFGVGINVWQSEDDLPAELRGVASSLFIEDLLPSDMIADAAAKSTTVTLSGSPAPGLDAGDASKAGSSSPAPGLDAGAPSAAASSSPVPGLDAGAPSAAASSSPVPGLDAGAPSAAASSSPAPGLDAGAPSAAASSSPAPGLATRREVIAELAARFDQALGSAYRRFQAGERELLRSTLRGRFHLRDAEVEVRDGRVVHRGRAVDIGPLGELILEDESGRVTVRSGTVERYHRPDRAGTVPGAAARNVRSRALTSSPPGFRMAVQDRPVRACSSVRVPQAIPRSNGMATARTIPCRRPPLARTATRETPPEPGREHGRQAGANTRSACHARDGYGDTTTRSTGHAQRTATRADRRPQRRLRMHGPPAH
ncbi:MAG: biotin--[acetyl-CoA-carboxylase] ligase [Candidatus Eisenbacteria bacterium]